MPTNRPFFASFFAVFRAHSAVPKASSTSTSTNIASSASTSTTSPFAAQTVPGSAARSIATKSASTPAQTTTSPGATTAAVQAANQHLRQASTSPQPQTHTPSSFGGRHTTQSPLQGPVSPTRTGGWARRGSDSSSDSAGFREVLGAEKWYVGGRTAGGEERFLALKMVKREGSWERRSADQMSL